MGEKEEEEEEEEEEEPGKMLGGNVCQSCAGGDPWDAEGEGKAAAGGEEYGCCCGCCC